MSLILSGLTKSYRQGEDRIEILNDLNLEVAAGEVVAIVGQSGSGKSTLLSLLSGLDQPDRGQIVIDGTDLTSLSIEAKTSFRAHAIGIVFQQFHLIPHLTAEENVALPLEINRRPDALTFARDMLEQVQLGHRFHHLPAHLSGGESQRVALARALLLRPRLLLADEPSGNLDQQTGDHVMDLLFEQVRRLKTTTVLVTHNPDLAKKCDRTFALRGGKCVRI